MVTQHSQQIPPPSEVPEHSIGDPKVNPAYQPLSDDPDDPDESVTPDSVPVRDAPPRLPPDR